MRGSAAARSPPWSSGTRASRRSRRWSPSSPRRAACATRKRSPPDMEALADLQAWMQSVILAGGAEGARARVRDGNRLTAEARVGIYAGGYRLRLIECLRAEYPLLRRLAGPPAFDLFAQGYIAARPSRSYTLYDFGAGFADYLEASRPAGGGTPQTMG